MFAVQTTRRNLRTQQSPVILDSCLKKPRAGKSRDYRDVIVFENFRFQNVFRRRENENPAFSNSFGLKSVFEKLRFCDGLVWTVGLTVEIKLPFQIPLRSVVCTQLIHHSINSLFSSTDLWSSLRVPNKPRYSCSCQGSKATTPGTARKGGLKNERETVVISSYIAEVVL